MAEYVCPGCAENGNAEDCWHSEAAWPLAEAMRDGVERLHPETARKGYGWERGSVTGAWYFIEDAEAVLKFVGPAPWSIEFTHPGAGWASVGLINQRYVVGVEDGEGDVPFGFIVDLRDLRRPEGIYPFECRLDGEAFASVVGLSEHYRLTHAGQQPIHDRQENEA